MKLRQHWRAVFRGVAAILLPVGLVGGYWWFYKLAPARRTASPEWRLSHSEREYWGEVQKGIRRGVWLHDDGFTVGWYGDRSWAEWIMANVSPGDGMSCMDRLCHSDYAMSCITNHDVGGDSGAWLDWWAENRSKSQAEWIADGFRQRGVEIDVPPSSDQVPTLLGLLGDPDANESEEIIEHVKYNAFRCLRDSGFDPVAYAISNLSVSEDVERGLLEYAKLERFWPSASRLGILPFGKTEDADQDYDVARMLTAKFQLAAYALVFGPLVLGMGLLAWSFRKGSSEASAD